VEHTIPIGNLSNAGRRLPVSYDDQHHQIALGELRADSLLEQLRLGGALLQRLTVDTTLLVTEPSPTR
jgi:hypothetical protein